MGQEGSCRDLDAGLIAEHEGGICIEGDAIRGSGRRWRFVDGRPGLIHVLRDER